MVVYLVDLASDFVPSRKHQDQPFPSTRFLVTPHMKELAPDAKGRFLIPPDWFKQGHPLALVAIHQVGNAGFAKFTLIVHTQNNQSEMK